MILTDININVKLCMVQFITLLMVYICIFYEFIIPSVHIYKTILLFMSVKKLLNLDIDVKFICNYNSFLIYP